MEAIEAKFCFIKYTASEQRTTHLEEMMACNVKSQCPCVPVKTCLFEAWVRNLVAPTPEYAEQYLEVPLSKTAEK